MNKLFSDVMRFNSRPLSDIPDDAKEDFLIFLKDHLKEYLYLSQMVRKNMTAIRERWGDEYVRSAVSEMKYPESKLKMLQAIGLEK